MILCIKVVFKMDRNGNGEGIELEKVFGAESTKPSFRSFDMKLFTGMCILAGCDFLPSVPGIGIARAHALVSKYRNLDRVLSVLKFEKGDQMPEDYAKSFEEAVAVFEHARIYDANTKELRHMKPLPHDFLETLDGNLDFLGPYPLFVFLLPILIDKEIPPTIAAAIAEGNLNPSTKEAFDKSECLELSPQPVTLRLNGKLRKTEVPAPTRQENCFAVFGSNTREKSTVTKQELVSDKDKYSDEALALQKLIMPLRTIENTILTDDTPLKFPNNNPFKLRKTEEISLVETENTMENVSFVNSIEYIDLCLSPDRFEEEGSEIFSRKRKFEEICSDQLQTSDEQISGVTEVENSDILCLTQGSVSSKTMKSANLKGKDESKKISKRSKFKKAVSSNGTILNFFSRV
ncbi:putative exodeoxyribonuclease I [Lupinus albus]|uniref:Exonuclease 1 n=1 Tax=Lupinus albus TaxID=3870 RepID=A0A6A4NF25_LUPAL|nr:putative exodeoxyribonuclease I [Lupinus albus]